MFTTNNNIENTVHELLSGAVARFGNHTAIVDQETKLSFKDVDVLSLRLAGHLIEMGLKKGDVVAVQLPNSWEFAVTHLALARIGLIMMPVNLMYRKKELTFMFSFAEVKAVVTVDKWKDFDHRTMMEDLKKELPHVEHIIVVGETNESGQHSFSTLLQTNPVSQNDLASYAPSPADKMIIMFTSGTESDPKAVVHTYKTFVPTHLHNGAEYQMTPNDIILCLTPLSHMFSLPMIILALKNGCKHVMLDSFSVEKTLGLFEREGVTFCVAAPTHLIDILKALEKRERVNTRLRMVLTGGSKIPAQMVKDFRQRFKCGMAAQWGMTELGAGTFTRPDDPPHFTWDTVGRAGPTGEVQIFGEDRMPLPVGEVGEIGFRGASLFEGYYKNEKATQEGMTADGFFLTGDLGWKDSKGYIHYVGRKKDTINRGGLKVHAAEIEDALLMHPKIKQAAVISVPDERLGERGCAILSLREGETFSLEEMAEYLLGLGMAKYKLPEYLKIVEELPITASGKVSKGVLRKKFSTVDIKKSS